MLPDFLADVSIKTGPVPAGLDGATAAGVLWQAAPGRFLLETPEVARYLVVSGCAITIEPAPKAYATAVERYLRMTPLAALLYQRGVPAFHAAAAANADGAVLLAGNSGAGKSTLLATLIQRGWTMLSDELSVVELDDQGKAVVRSTYPEVAVWPDTLEKLGMNASLLPRCDSNRHILSMADRFTVVSQPLRAIYWLSVHNDGYIALDEQEGAARFRASGILSYNSHIADALFDRIAFMRCATVIAQSVPIKRLRRPQGIWSAEELADRIAS
jgi:hypothetical protein